MRRLMLLFLSLLTLSLAPNAQPQTGRVPFDYPNEPFVEFQFDLDRSMIALVMENMSADTASLFNTLDYLHLRTYKARHFDKMLDHYGINLKAHVKRKCRVRRETEFFLENSVSVALNLNMSL